MMLLVSDHKPSQIGANVLRIRRARGLSQRGLAVKAGLARQTVANLERGETYAPDTETLEALASALGVNPAAFWEEPGSAEPAPAEMSEPSGRMSLAQFVEVERAFLSPHQVQVLERLRTSIDPRGLTLDQWRETARIVFEEITAHARRRGPGGGSGGGNPAT